MEKALAVVVTVVVLYLLFSRVRCGSKRSSRIRDYFCSGSHNDGGLNELEYMHRSPTLEKKYAPKIVKTKWNSGDSQEFGYQMLSLRDRELPMINRSSYEPLNLRRGKTHILKKIEATS